MSLKVLTYNVWFDPTHLLERTKVITAILRSARADVVCLQEVTQPAHELLQRDESLSSLYAFSAPLQPPAGEKRSWYYALMLVRCELNPFFQTVDLPTEMQRQLVVATIDLGEYQGIRGKKMAIATAHFESMDSRRLRREQLLIASEVMSRFPAWVLCGDFNFCSYQNFGGRNPGDLENTVLADVLPPHVDAWPALHPPTEPGFTFDSEKNANVEKFEQMRYDRVLCSLPHCKPHTVSLVGTESFEAPTKETIRLAMPPSRPSKLRLPPDATDGSPPRWVKTEQDVAIGNRTPSPSRGVELHPSDHFGVACHIDISHLL